VYISQRRWRLEASHASPDRIDKLIKCILGTALFANPSR
jgi:hypothetical protein